MTASGHVELPTVPRASDHFAAECSLTQRTTLVRANSVDSVQLAINIVEGHDSISGNPLEHRARRTFGHARNRDPIGHIGQDEGGTEQTRRQQEPL